MKDLLYTIADQARTRVVFLAAMAITVGLLLAAYHMDSAFLAAIAAVAAFWAGEENGGQTICNDCAVDLVSTTVEIPERSSVI